MVQWGKHMPQNNRGNLTPLSQRVAVERYTLKQKNKGLIEVTVWCPVTKADEIKRLAHLMRAEYELEDVKHDKEAE